MAYHYLCNQLAQSQHRIGIDLIGLGGTGSHMLTNLAILSNTLYKIGKQPFFVRSFDPDIIEEHNCSRQAFSKSEIGLNKSDVLVNRCNRFFNTDWISYPCKYEEMTLPKKTGYPLSNITVTCVDSIEARKSIYEILKKKISNLDLSHFDYSTPVYWLDIGNTKKQGQIILGTILQVKNLNIYENVYKLPCFFDEFPDVKGDPDEPSCSLAESLGKQDLFINKIMATYASNMLWQLFHEYRINYRGIYVNLETMMTKPILI